jgi:toxic protein SymE
MKDLTNRRDYGVTKSGKTLPYERTFTVRESSYDYQFLSNEPSYFARQPVSVPLIFIKGYWLIEAGFGCNTAIVAKISKGEIVLSAG